MRKTRQELFECEFYVMRIKFIRRNRGSSRDPRILFSGERISRRLAKELPKGYVLKEIEGKDPKEKNCIILRLPRIAFDSFLIYCERTERMTLGGYLSKYASLTQGYVAQHAGELDAALLLKNKGARISVECRSRLEILAEI